MSKKKDIGWDKLPKGWTEKSVQKFWKTISDKNPEHPFQACVDKMTGKLDNPEAFCASTKDQALGTTMWRSTERKKNKKEAGLRKKLIKLAYERPDLRKKILPLLGE